MESLRKKGSAQGAAPFYKQKVRGAV